MDPAPDAEKRLDMMRNGRARVRKSLLWKVIGGFWAAGLMLQAAGCGPITTTNNVAKARVAIAAAEAAGAEKGAVYEYVTAIEYLRKAREEEGFSDYQAAIDYALISREFAEKAKTRAESEPNPDGPIMPAAPKVPAPYPTKAKPKPTPAAVPSNPPPSTPPSGSSL